MNTQNNTFQTPVDNITPGPEISSDAPPPATPPESKPKLSTLRIALILLAMLILGGGVAFFAVKQQNISDTSSDSFTNLPEVTGTGTGLNLAVSDDPEILEAELNDIYLENIDEELGSIEDELNSL